MERGGGHMRLMKLGNRRGQSILEYLVIAAAIILVIIGVLRGIVTARMTNLGTETGNAIDKAAVKIGTVDAQVH